MSIPVPIQADTHFLHCETFSSISIGMGTYSIPHIYNLAAANTQPTKHVFMEHSPAQKLHFLLNSMYLKLQCPAVLGNDSAVCLT